MKACSKCGVVKALDAFCRDASRPSGRRPQCRACTNSKNRASYQSRRERRSEQIAAWGQANRELKRGYTRRWRANNSEKCRAYAAANSDAYAANCARRRAAKLRATPAWANLDHVAAFYTLAEVFTKSTGVPHEVDHIEPLRGRHVCGLHNEFNLQVLPAKFNAAKGNRPSEVRGFR